MDPHDRHDTDRFGTLQPYVMRVCTGRECGVRFPVAAANIAYATCHLCQSPTVVAAEVARLDATTSQPARREVWAIFDNIRSALNVGTMLRTAEGAGIHRVYLGGISPTPENPKVQKTSLGAESEIVWSHHPNLVPTVEDLVSEGLLVWALEYSPTSIAFDEVSLDDVGLGPIAIVAGNEIAGVDPAILALATRHVHLPMRGQKNSLNVAVAFGVLAYWLQH